MLLGDEAVLDWFEEHAVSLAHVAGTALGWRAVTICVAQRREVVAGPAIRYVIKVLERAALLRIHSVLALAHAHIGQSTARLEVKGIAAPRRIRIHLHYRCGLVLLPHHLNGFLRAIQVKLVVLLTFLRELLARVVLSPVVDASSAGSLVHSFVDCATLEVGAGALAVGAVASFHAGEEELVTHRRVEARAELAASAAL